MKKFIKNFKFFWKALWSKGPCVYCGRNARNMSWSGEFIHLNCEIVRQNEKVAKREQEKADRHQVDLMKQALRELELEKDKR